MSSGIHSFVRGMYPGSSESALAGHSNSQGCYHLPLPGHPFISCHSRLPRGLTSGLPWILAGGDFIPISEGQPANHHQHTLTKHAHDGVRGRGEVLLVFSNVFLLPFFPLFLCQWCFSSCGSILTTGPLIFSGILQPPLFLCSGARGEFRLMEASPPQYTRPFLGLLLYEVTTLTRNEDTFENTLNTFENKVFKLIKVKDQEFPFYVFHYT